MVNSQSIAYIIDNKPVLLYFSPKWGIFSSKGLGSFKAEIDKDSLDG